MVSLVVFGLAVALLVLHFVDRRVPIGYALAAFIMSAIVAAGDVRESAGQTCTTTTTTKTVTTTGPLGVYITTQTYPVETCTVEYTLRFESLTALVASMAFTALTLLIYVLERLREAATGGWSV